MLYSPAALSCLVCFAGVLFTGCPPPDIHPPLHAITSIRSYCLLPSLISLRIMSAFLSPWITAILISAPSRFTVASLTSSSPLTSSNRISRSILPNLSPATSLSTASVTPPVFPNIMPAPDATPKGISIESSSRSVNLTPISFIIIASS